MDIIKTQQAPEAIGPYSQAVKAGTWVFCSGQIPLDPVSMSVVRDTITEQTQQVFVNLEAVLTAAGSSLKQVVKTTGDFGPDLGIGSPIDSGQSPMDN